VELPVLEEAPLPPSTPGMTPVTLIVPDDTFAGMDMAVEWGGASYSIVVPDGVGPGQEITVELPSLDDASSSALPPEQEPEPTGGLVDAPSEPASRYLEACLHAGKAAGSMSVGPFPFHTAGTYDLMQDVEVYRTDGSWSPARVVYYDEAGDTYDVELLHAPGVMKYMQEPDYLRPIEMGSFVRHQGVQVLEARTWVWARIDDFKKDDTRWPIEFTVTVELIDGQLRQFTWGEWCCNSRPAKKPVAKEIWAFDSARYHGAGSDSDSD